jgi:hypothetical protein
MEHTTKIATYNMHGLRQGLPYLSELCDMCNIVLVQEHWLGSADFNKLDVSPNHMVFASSAIDNVLSSGVLQGRPFGGVAVLVHKSFAIAAKLIYKSD